MNDFDLWNILKQKVDARKNSYAPYAKEGDVWVASVGRNIGTEENGKGATFSRPVLILKKFSRETAWILSLSSKQKRLKFYYNFRDPLNKPSTIILSQLRVISTKRLNRKLYSFSNKKFQRVRNIVRKYL